MSYPQVQIRSQAEVLGCNGEVYELRLKNSKRVIGYLSKQLKAADARFEAKQIVNVELSPADLDKARIVSACAEAQADENKLQ